jgi:hypothetical protein
MDYCTLISGRYPIVSIGNKLRPEFFSHVKRNREPISYFVRSFL